MKVLVTGATGFTGEWVMKELDISEHTAVAFSGDVRDKSTFPKEPVRRTFAKLIPRQR
jgi:uncharacterized protein YbjT (DUF2867 family)